MDNISTVIIGIITGSVGAAVVALISNVIMFKLNRKATVEDKQDKKEDEKEIKEEEWKKKLTVELDNLTAGQKTILLDRIRYLGETYIKSGKIKFDDRHKLHLMYDAYHSLGGNGDLKLIMAEVDDLTLAED